MIQLKDVSLALGHHPPLLEHIDLTLHPGERIALVGRNGAGKSTLLRLLEGRMEPDEGQVLVPTGVAVACLEQQLPEDASGTVFQTVAEGVGELGAALEAYQRLTDRLAQGDMAVWDDLERVQARLDAGDGWRLKQRIEAVITQLGLEPESRLADLSGGVQRRVLLGRALVREPDLLLLDEPTNHLDIESITRLESFLKEWRGALLFITHDRAFLRSLATRIVELDRGRVRDYPGDYETYLRRREELLATEARQNAEFDRRLAQEERWIRQGIKARRTRNQGRVRNLQAMRAERAERREHQGSARMSIQEARRSGRIVVETENLHFAWPGHEDQPLVHDLTTQILRGDRIGLIGPNGCGKTTLIRILLGEIQPSAGRVRQGASLEVAYFDQRRDVLDDDASVQDNVGGGRETLRLNGQERHVLSYLQDFLFAPSRARQPVRALSGGERNRLLLARLFARPSNVLVLDEPTNDLDTDTLDLLEERLHDYSGTVLLVSHDREFLDRVVTASLVHEGATGFREYAGGYTDWLAQQPASPSVGAYASTSGPAQSAQQSHQQRSSPNPGRRASEPRVRLSKREESELAALPERIQALEREQEAVEQALGDPALYQGETGQARLAELQAERERLDGELAAALERWEALEARQESPDS